MFQECLYSEARPTQKKIKINSCIKDLFQILFLLRFVVMIIGLTQKWFLNFYSNFVPNFVLIIERCHLLLLYKSFQSFHY